MFTRSFRTAIFPMLAVLLAFFTKEQTVLSAETTVIPTVTDSAANFTSSTLPGQTELKSHRLCGSDMVHYCANGGQCVYYQNHDTPSCMCKSPFEGQRCMTIMSKSRCSVSHWPISVIVGLAIVFILLALLILCCFYKRCFKSAPLKSEAKIQV